MSISVSAPSLDDFAPPGAAASRALVLVSSVFINLLALALPIVILHVYDRVLPNGSLPTLLVLGLGLGVALILEAILRACRAAVSARAGAATEHTLRSNVMARLLGAPLNAAAGQGPEVHLDRLNAAGILRDRLSGQVAVTVMDLHFAALFLAVIAAIGGWLVLVPLTVMVVFAAAAWLVGRALKRISAARSEADRRRHGFLLAVLRGVGSVKALGLEAPLSGRYDRLQEDSAATVRATAWQGGLAQTLGALAGQVNIAAMVGIGAAMVMTGDLSAGQLAACTLLVGRALQPVQTALGSWSAAQEAAVARDKVAAALSLPLETPETGEPGAGPCSVELRDITLHPGGPGISLALAAGEAVSIQGAVGSGKSTLLLTMLGLAEVGEGCVLIDGVPRHPRSGVALLPQRGRMFEGTLLQNLTGFRDGEAEEDTMALAFLLGLDTLVRRLPDGYATMVGSRLGQRLSGGVRQQVAVIRALVGRPRLILFDEANQGLDSITSGRLRDLLAGMKGRTTLVLVSGDPDIRALADRHFVLADGALSLDAGEPT